MHTAREYSIRRNDDKETPMTSVEAYEILLEKGKEIAYLGSTVGLLHWDQRTTLPPKGHPHRVGQIALLVKMIHQRATDPEIGDLLSMVEGSGVVGDPHRADAVNVREWRRGYDRMTKIPESLAVEIARTTAEAQSVWERARPENDWERFQPYLARIVALKRQEAQAVGYAGEPYDALLDHYEQGATAKELEPIFSRLVPALKQLLDRIEGSSKVPPRLPAMHFPVEEQRAFALETAQKLGYDIEAGRLDLSAHPFTTGLGPGDVRITARYRENSINEGLFSVIHEAGHAMYHQGLPLDHWGEPLCRPISLGINESQSRMWENMVARSRAFWEHFYPIARQRFPTLRQVSLDDFLYTLNEVHPSLIRTEADEVTYNLHIVLRFELEIALMRGELQVDDLPEAWNLKTREYLGLTPPDYAYGVMQDVHWSSGAIGYFPTYTLGNLCAAQFLDAARRELGNLGDLFRRGEFAPLLGWLREKIHSQGSRFLPQDLLGRVTGQDLNPGYFIEYLERKYGSLYGL